MLPTTAILARDLEINWSDGGTLAAAMAEAQALGRELRFGPFLLSRAIIGKGHISTPDPQVFGFLSELLPRSPDPDPRLPWPRHQAAQGLAPADDCRVTEPCPRDSTEYHP